MIVEGRQKLEQIEVPSKTKTFLVSASATVYWADLDKDGEEPSGALFTESQLLHAKDEKEAIKKIQHLLASKIISTGDLVCGMGFNYPVECTEYSVEALVQASELARPAIEIEA